jgi:iron transport multicopper oxidase
MLLFSIGINGTHPGPSIIVNAGDRIIARVKNLDIKAGTAVHWHGIRQTLSNNMDGAVGITQLPIKVGETFTYDFVVDGAGTFWYHAHFMTQYMQGMRGALIVQDPMETMYSNRIVMLADWYHEVSPNRTVVCRKLH